MTTKAIKERVTKGKPLTKQQKLCVLKDARKMLSNRNNWSQGAWVRVTDEETGELVSEDNFRYVPSKSESTAMCVMGAVACAAGLQGEVRDPSDAMTALTNCDLGTVMMEALPKSKQMPQQDIYEWWADSDSWYDFDWKTNSKNVDKSIANHLGSDGYPTKKAFKIWLKANKYNSPLAWYVDYSEGEALEMIYGVNDDRDDADKAYKNTLNLLDKAIKNLEAA